MSDLVIRADNLGKQYRIGTARPRYKTLRESIVDTFRAPFRLFSNSPSAIRNPQSEEIWALKDVSFEIKPGEVVGVIGRNGAGKSTLLKILSRITEPSEGRAEIHGRVGSLLEVGTGFHPELTGRENIYLSGAILGMKRAEIERRFDEMVAFAEVERFIDTPVKHYSSGMYLRLAFSVAAHLEPEILLVDEVLAVGDVGFQKKCLGKMGDVAHQGRTVLFVSHNMGAILKLCNMGLLLGSGRLAFAGDVKSCVGQYLESAMQPDGARIELPPAAREAPGSFTHMMLTDDEGRPTQEFKLRQSWRLRVGFEMRCACEHVIWAFGLTSPQFGAIATQWSKPMSLEPGKYMAEYRWSRPTLAAGHYSFTLGLSSFERTFHYLEDQGRLVVSGVADSEQPVRASDCGILLLEDEFCLIAGGDMNPGVQVVETLNSSAPVRRDGF